MKILSVDIGTGTQDILLYDTDLHPENCFKMVAPSPTMMVAQKVRQATKLGTRLLLEGVTMGGGPCHWAVRDHAIAGYDVFATKEAAQTFDDNLDRVTEMGITIVSSDEAQRLRTGGQDCCALELHDFDYGMIRNAFRQFGVEMSLDGIAVAVFDHGAAPPDISDRQFRFDYLDERLKTSLDLSGFAFPANSAPEEMTRLQAVVKSASMTGMPGEIPLMVMDTAPAAIVGAQFDPHVTPDSGVIMANVGNFHTLAFRFGRAGVEGVFEHHTGELDTGKLDDLLIKLAEGSLEHLDVFNDHGHGALLYNRTPMENRRVVVTGPRRSMMYASTLPVYMAVPFGDMMIAGCFGMIDSWSKVMPGDWEAVESSLVSHQRVAPWELL